MKIYALIPARGGSKGIMNKNIVDYNSKPLIYYSIKIAKESKLISEVYVSSDSDLILNISKQYGAKTIKRPTEFAQDDSPDIDTFQHFVKTLQLKDDDIIVHLRPTFPNRNVEFLDKCISEFVIKIASYDSYRTVVPVEKSPAKMYRIKQDRLIPLFHCDFGFEEPYNQCRQVLPQFYLHNGCIDIVKAYVIKQNSMSGKNIMPKIMEELNDIDSDKDLMESLYTKKRKEYIEMLKNSIILDKDQINVVANMALEYWKIYGENDDIIMSLINVILGK